MSKSVADRTKVVVRNLPPTLSREAFVSTIDKHAEGTYNWLAYYQGKVR
jgi:regulator of nonsense transcripts 3